MCVLIEQINYILFFWGGLVMCNEDETGPCLKLKMLQILCEENVQALR